MMLELTGMGSVLRGIGVLYWLLAFGVLFWAIYKSPTRRDKIISAVIVALIFGALPSWKLIEQYQKNSFAKEAWAYFKNKCETEAGEKIYKTFTGVNSVLVVKPLPPATEKDLYDQFWYGDPYSSASTYKRAESAAVKLVMDWKHRTGQGSQQGLAFVEIKHSPEDGYLRIYRPVSNDKRAVREEISEPVSKFGVAWEDISTAEDRKFWIAGSRFQVIDLSDNSVVAERIGFLIETGFGSTIGQRRPWQTSRGIGPNGRSCPDAFDPTDQWFVTSVFKQDGER